MSRVRNEALVIEDTIKHLESFCDGIVIYDDCSTDNTVFLIKQSAKKLLHLEEGKLWRPNRVVEETRHRALLLKMAARYNPQWFFYADADERFIGEIQSILSALPKDIDGIQVQLFDAYLTGEFCSPYIRGDRLENLERLYGIERRDILMAWRNSKKFHYIGLDAREPVPRRKANIIKADIYCKHFGKAISIAQWEETCDYYEKHFPEPYSSKWAERHGKAIHVYSDFGTLLYTWDEVKKYAIPIYP